MFWHTEVEGLNAQSPGAWLMMILDTWDDRALKDSVAWISVLCDVFWLAACNAGLRSSMFFLYMLYMFWYSGLQLESWRVSFSTYNSNGLINNTLRNSRQRGLAHPNTQMPADESCNECEALGRSPALGLLMLKTILSPAVSRAVSRARYLQG